MRMCSAAEPSSATHRNATHQTNRPPPPPRSVGTTLKIEAHTFEPDGKILLVNKGIERFRVTKVVKERPVLICEVEVMQDDDDATPEVGGGHIPHHCIAHCSSGVKWSGGYREAVEEGVFLLCRTQPGVTGARSGAPPPPTPHPTLTPPTAQATALAGEVAEMFRNVLRLYRKMRRRGAGGGAGGAPMGGAASTEPEEEQEEPEELTEFNPTQVGGVGGGVLGGCGCLGVWAVYVWR